MYSYLLKTFQRYKECTPNSPKIFIFGVFKKKLSHENIKNSITRALQVSTLQNHLDAPLLIKAFYGDLDLAKQNIMKQTDFLNNMICQGIIFCLVANVISIPTSEKLHFLALLLNLCNSQFFHFSMFLVQKADFLKGQNFGLSPFVGDFASLETLDKALGFLHSFEGNWKACRNC